MGKGFGTLMSFLNWLQLQLQHRMRLLVVAIVAYLQKNLYGFSVKAFLGPESPTYLAFLRILYTAKCSVNDSADCIDLKLTLRM